MRNRYAFPLTNYKNNYSTAATKLSRGTNIDWVLIYSSWGLWFQKSKLNLIQELCLKMFCSDKWIWTFANFFCTLSFLVQLFDFLPSYQLFCAYNDQHSDIKWATEKYWLSPRYPDLCQPPAEHQRPARVHFQQSDILPDFSNGTIGWGGLDNETGAMASAEEVLEVVRMNVTAAEVLKHVCIRTHESKGTENMGLVQNTKIQNTKSS